MAEEVQTLTEGKLAVGAVLSRTFGIYFSNFVSFTLLASIVYTPLIVFQLIDFGSDGGAMQELIAGILNYFLSAVLSAALVYGTIVHLRHGQCPSVLTIISRGLAVVFPVILVSIVSGVLVGIGTLLFVIPGLIVMTILFVCVPGAVVERNGLGASLSRSAELTKGNRWPVFGVVVVLWLIQFLAVLGIGALVGVSIFANQSSPEEPVFAVIIVTLFQALTAGILAVGSAVVYHGLRIIKEGEDMNQIAAVFD